MSAVSCVILCISDTYLPRARLLAREYSKQKKSTLILTPDFSHKTKQKITASEEGVRYLPHRPYEKNLSLARLFGHMEFARLAFQELEALEPEIVHALVPANSLAHQAARYKKAHPDTKLILDLNDLWPESLPMGFARHTPPAWYWKALRNRSLPYADLLLVECDLFAREIQAQTNLHAHVLYWAGETETKPSFQPLDAKTLDLCYLGFVNNIIDLAALEELFASLSALRPVRLHLIAQGARKDEMKERLGKSAEIIDYGTVYDPQKKQAIFDRCAFGINLMKKGVMAGLSMKTLDYMQGGLPVLNSLTGDVHDWIEEDGIGINIDHERIGEAARQIAAMSPAQILEEKKAARKLFENRLSNRAFEASFQRAITRIEP